MATMRQNCVRRLVGVFGAMAALTVLVNAAEAVPDPSTDREFSAKVRVCNECHGVNGVPRNATIPVIWGQQENYLVRQLHDYKSGHRDVEVMSWMAKTFTEQEVGVAAAYFAKQKWPAPSAGAASSPPPAGIAACQACHATDFRGATQAPRLVGQSYEYLVEAMRRFTDREWKNDAMMKIMTAISPADQEAMARYLSGF